MKKVTDIEAALCHEWGHALMSYIIMGSSSNIESIEVTDDFWGVKGSTNIKLLAELTAEQKALILFGGIVAENICGYSKTSLHRGTDADRLRILIPDKRRLKELRSKAFQMLDDKKEVLSRLTENAFAHLPARDTNGQIYYRIFHDDLARQIRETMPST